jgi:hypothetical protein
MIVMEERSMKENKEKTLQLAQIFVIELKVRHPPNVQEN